MGRGQDDTTGRPPVAGPPAWFDYAGRRFYRVPSGYNVARDGRSPLRLHQAIWEQAHQATIPPGHEIHHDDEDRSNNDPGNLVALTHAEHAARHRGATRDAEARTRIREGVAQAWERRPWRTLRCRRCGNEFRTRATRLVEHCSKRCKRADLRSDRAGLGPWAPAGRPCDRCGLPFLPKDRRARFCGKACRDADLSDRRKAKRADRRI